MNALTVRLHIAQIDWPVTIQVIKIKMAFLSQICTEYNMFRD